MKRLSLLLILLIMLTSLSCKEEIDAMLTMKKMPYTGNELRIDGYYYGVIDNFGAKLYPVYFFYRNGVFRYGGTFKSLDEIPDDWGDGNSRLLWGYFEVRDSTFRFERWQVTATVERSGVILNDSTFRITQRRLTSGESPNPQVESIDELYHFVRYSPKPDSVNRFLD